jgi:hypothetical protein
MKRAIILTALAVALALGAGSAATEVRAET